MEITALLDVRRVFARTLLFSLAAFLAAMLVSFGHPVLAKQLIFLAFSGLLLLVYYLSGGAQGESLPLYGGLTAIAIASCAWMLIVVLRSAVYIVANSNDSDGILVSALFQLTAPFKGDALHYATTMVAVLGGAIWEEAFFRGMLQGILLRRLPHNLVVAMVASIFMLSHSPTGFAHGLMFFTFSVLMSAMYRYFGMLACIILHAFYNYPLALEAELRVGMEIRSDPFTMMPYTAEQTSAYILFLAAIPILCTYLVARLHKWRKNTNSPVQS